MSQNPLSSAHHGRLNLEQQKKRARELLREWQADASVEQPTLAKAQWQIARAQGFSSWPKLKAHIDALNFAARHPDFAASDEASTRHWRCGNDIEHSLTLAGFRGRFQMMADPLCMGPVQDLPFDDYKRQRAHYLSQAFGLELAAAQQRADHEYGELRKLGDGPAVLWCEADSYDQLFLVRALAGLEALPAHLSLIQINAVPGVQRFIGIGQLAPDVLAWLWPQRRRVTAEALALAQRTWAAYCAPSPMALAEIAHTEHPELPLLAAALRRQLQELPGVNDGLSLTERLALQTLRDSASGEMPFGRVFAELMAVRDPLPFLGDMMFHALLRPLIDSPTPLLHEAQPELDWPRRPLRLTALGDQVLDGHAYWPDHAQATRWVGGVCIAPHQPHWMIDPQGQPLWRGSR